MPSMPSTPFDLHTALTRWGFGPFQLLVIAGLLALATWYLRADWELARRGRRWSPYRRAAFMAGLVTVDLALQSPVATLSGSYFQAHVLQHLLLMVVGPPLLALGAPSTLLLQTSSRRTKQWWLRALHSGPFAAVSNPVVVWFLYYGAMFAFFLTSAVGFSMDHMVVMDLANLGFLAGATLFWWPVIGVDPIPRWSMSYGAKIVNLLIGVPVEAFLGITIINESKPIAPMYTLASTHAGGGLLWVLSEAFSVLAVAPIFVQWMRSEDRRAARHDAREDAAFDAEAAAEAAIVAVIAAPPGRPAATTAQAPSQQR